MRLFLSGFALGLGLASAATAQETQTYTYDAHGRLTRIVRTAGTATRTTNYTLDNADNRTQRATTVTTGSGLMAQADAESAVTNDTGSDEPRSNAAEASNATSREAPVESASNVRPNI
jgi:YD repeat-containing protein